jgi:hypothetical protein
MNASEQTKNELKSPAPLDDKVALIAELIYEIIEAEDGSHE